MSASSPRLSRRNFLLSVGAGGAATAAAIVAKTVGAGFYWALVKFVP